MGPSYLRARLVCLGFLMLVLASCGSTADTGEGASGSTSFGVGATQVGIASYYGPGLYGNRTSSGKVLRPPDVLAAHRSIPLGTWICVTNLDNNRVLSMPVLDRGPFHYGRILDLSEAAKDRLGMGDLGSVKLVVLAGKDEPCGEPTVRQTCQKALTAKQESQSEDILSVKIEPSCPAQRVMVELASPNGDVSMTKVTEELIQEENGDVLAARVDFSAMRSEGDFGSARVILIDAKGKEIYRTGSPVPSPRISPHANEPPPEIMPK